MCTVSIIPIPGGYRLVHNRDERRDRVAGEPPAWRRFALPGGGQIEALAPLDPAAGGTWLATMHSGVTAAVLNLNPPRSVTAPDSEDDGGSWLAAPPGYEGSKSRGVAIIEALHAVDRGADPAEIGPEAFAGTRPCRTLLVRPIDEAHTEVVVATYAPDEFVHPPAGPVGRFVLGNPSGCDRAALCWVSSGLGDDVVVARMPLFEAMVLGDPAPEVQDAFHRHRWEDRPEQSVRMSRPDARTVSITTLEVDGDGARMHYEAVADDPAEAVRGGRAQ